VLCYGSVRLAEAVVRAVCPDNVGVPRGLFVETLRRERKVFAKVVCEGGLRTFVGTVDDLLGAVCVVERCVLAVR